MAVSPTTARPCSHLAGVAKKRAELLEGMDNDKSRTTLADILGLDQVVSQQTDGRSRTINRASSEDASVAVGR